MSFEIEKRFKNFNYKHMKELLKKNNIKKEGSYLYKVIMYHSLKEGQIIRIRDEGNKITFTIKQKNTNNYSTEWEIIVNDFLMINQMLDQLNVKKIMICTRFVKYIKHRIIIVRLYSIIIQDCHHIWK